MGTGFRHLVIFIGFGALFTLLQPVLAQFAVLTLLLLILLPLALFIPGGWLLFSGLNSFLRLFRSVIVPAILVLLAALISLLAYRYSGPAAGLGLSFVIGGILGLIVMSRLGMLGGPPHTVDGERWPKLRMHHKRDVRPVEVVLEPPKGAPVHIVCVRGGWLRRRRNAGIFPSAFSGGIVVLGEAAVPAARRLVEGALEAGERVVVVGNPYLATPHPYTKMVVMGKVSVNIMGQASGDRFSTRRWAENVAVPLVVSAGLDTAEAGMVIRFLEKFAGSRLTPDDVDKIVAEYGPTSSARLKDALGMVTAFFGDGNPGPERLFGGGWRQLVIDTRGLSLETQLFFGMYILYEAGKLFPGCVLVFDGAEMGIPEQHVLPYDARLVWLRTLKAVERAREGGFIMISSTGLLAPQLLDIADTYVITRGPAHLRRSISERLGLDINPAQIPSGHAVVFTQSTPDGKHYVFEGEVLETPPPDISSLEAEAEREATLLREEFLSAFRDTLLYAELADMAEVGYRVLKTVSRLQTPTAEKISAETGVNGSKALKALTEKQYVIVDPAGVLALTSLGEQALRDWEAKTKGLRTNSTAYPADSRTSRDVEVVAGLAAYGEGVSKGSFDEALRLATRAKQMMSSGDELRAVGVAYRAAVTALKQLTGLEKGHLTDLAEKASEKGLLNIAEDEVRRLYAANIESKRLLKQVSEGLQLSAEDRKRMADAAELLASLAERVAALGEGGVE